MRNQLFIGIIFLFALGFSSCKKEQCLDGDEYPRGAVREVPPFKALNVNLSAIVEIVKDTTQKVELIVEENLETHITTSVLKDTLNIGLGFCFSSHAEITIRVHYDTLNTITVNGPTDVVSKSIMTQDDLTLNVNSSGNIALTTNLKNLVTNINGTGLVSLNGQVKYHLINHNGSGAVNSYQAMTDSVVTYMNGSGNNYLRVKKDLTAFINNSGDLFYKGNPQINGTITGSGEIIDDN
ncbi:MAG: GIN domain-containing protein [Salibacteraceae bacterium]